jgi:hypothetical protein
MTIISANDLKTRGISAIAKALKERSEVTVSVRGKARYVFMSNERYQDLRECELEVALAESKADLEADSFVRESVTQHLKYIGEINKKVR